MVIFVLQGKNSASLLYGDLHLYALRLIYGKTYKEQLTTTMVAAYYFRALNEYERQKSGTRNSYACARVFMTLKYSLN